ncbi:MAG: hypothetical protein JWR89_2780 [Tardiphaga sp.]|uniref:linalool dehydratase/isomerase domain-containing protein n=1 Tax=Tardiphaga sp. TaxID=1926292 RepID=UPI00262E3BA8|nr:hypothetical protein [Tardiphaga sp.]MDB5502878.1 hypothetical protein [Tardiphaga sp.]
MGSRTKSGTVRQGSAPAPLPRDVPAVPHRETLFGPIATKLQRRTYMVWLTLCILGAIPNILAVTLYPGFSVASRAFGWGLWLPGAGFVAVGGAAIWLFPLTLVIFVLSCALWLLCGAVILPPIIWIAAASVSYAMAGDSVSEWTWLIVPGVALTLYALHRYVLHWNYQTAVELGRKRAAALPAALAELDAVQSLAPDANAHELTCDEIAGARYIFDRALQPVGQFEGFTRIDNFQLAGLRYQLNYISYGLAMLQRKYLPNFHGYLNQAQRYAIESLTSPEVCGYWTWENAWGNLSLNPDPVGTKDDVMLAGLSLSALTCYAENTGDLQYQKSGALQFKPFKHRRRTYGHNAQSFVDWITWNWDHAIYYLYACEPHWVFPICNSYALCGVKPFDRTNGTSIAAAVYPPFMRGLEGEFIAPGGGLQPELSSLVGISPFWNVTQMQMDNLLSVSQVINAIHPGYAKLWYVLARHEYLELTATGLELKQGSWSDCTDFGNYQQNPGMALGTIALAAREHGDDIIAEAALRKAAELLTPVTTPGVLAYQDISNTANINLAVARWARRDHWLDVINFAPRPGAITGPILSDCAYPDVLVARAISNGTDLNLVLYDGKQPGRFPIRIARLSPGRSYAVEGAQPASLLASPDGAATLHVELNGRTVVRLRLQDTVH